MDITYRPARREDLDTAVRIVQEAYNDLRLRHGFAPIPVRPPLFQTFCLTQDPDGLWVAEAGQVILGFGFSWVCQKFWFLAQLFNTAFTGLYLRNGMYPREPLYRVIASAAVIEQHLPETGYDAVTIPPWPQPQEWIGSIDEEVPGFAGMRITDLCSTALRERGAD